MTTAQQIATRLVNVEDGYADVVIEGTDRVLGSVTREKHGSTRTGIHWTATYVSGRALGHGYTRADAVRMIVARAEQIRSRRA